MAINLSGYSAWGPEANLAALKQIGYTGFDTGSGQGDAYLKSLYSAGNYSALNDYKTARSSLQPTYNFDNLGFGAFPTSTTPAASTSSSTATTPTTYASGWGPDQNLAEIKKLGYTGNTIGNGEASQFLRDLASRGDYNDIYTYMQDRLAQQPNYNLAWEGIELPPGFTPGDPKYNGAPGVLPNTVQDLNSVQNTALDNLAKGAPDTGFSSQLAPIYQQMLAQIQAGANTGSYNPASASAYMNPYTQQVIDAYSNQANSQFDKLSNQIAARNARNGNAGSSAESNMLGGAATDILNNYNSTVANLLSSGYTQAQQQAQDAFYRDLQNKYTGANALSGALNIGQGLDNYLTGKYYNQNNIALNAGNIVQNQNQRQLDAANGAQGQDLAYQMEMLNLLKGILSSYPGGTATSSTTPGNAVGGAIGGGLLGYAASPYLSNLFGGSSVTSNGLTGGLGSSLFPSTYGF